MEEQRAEEVKEIATKKETTISYKKLLNLGFLIALIAIIVLGAWIRTTNISQLKDVTTGTYTLGPDLDPFLYLRHANEVVEGKLQDIDMMRAAPLGTANYAKTNLMTWAIVAIYKIFALKSVEFAAIIAPVIFFALTLIVFFLFMKKVFSFSDKKKAMIIALIATAFYAVIPAMQHRTTAGIPELESLGMLWFWLAFYFFTSAWQSDKIKKQTIFGVLAGIFTGLMIWTWGGYRYIFMSFAFASFLAFFFNKQKKKNFIIYAAWLIPSLIFALAKNPNFANFFQGVALGDTGLASIVFFILLVGIIISKTKLKEKIKIEKIRLPESIITLIIVIVIGLIALAVINPSLISQVFSKVVEGLLYPFGRGRVGLTVAENRAPYFVEVIGNFGKAFFWLFFFGTLLLFYEAIKHFGKKNKILLNLFFIIFLLSFIFSRISPQSALNGENFISKFLYFGGLAIFTIALLCIYINSYRKKDEKTLDDFKEINFSYFLILAFIFWMIVSMRGAVRLFFIISPALIIASAFLPIKLTEYSFKTKDSLCKMLLWCAVVVTVIFLIATFVSYEKTTATSVKYTMPGAYYQQWQKAMAWVRESTPQDAIFVHWWDYGYWIQTWGKRATVTDGGHAIGYWDHTTARYLMTAQNEKTALQLCKAHNVSYFLIDSSDIGKYTAYSSIGSDKSGNDRLSWVGTFLLDEKQTQELRNETLYVYTGGVALDQDIVWQGQLFPANKAAVGALIMHIDKETQAIKEIEAIFFYNNKQTRIPIRYVWLNNRKTELKKDEALNTMLYIMPRLTQEGRINNLGSALYLSEKALNAQWVRLYLLDETENFKLVHTEDALFVEQLKNVYNITIGDFIFANGLQGPIKIWKVNYPTDIKVHEEYLKMTGNWAELDYFGT